MGAEIRLTTIADLPGQAIDPGTVSAQADVFGTVGTGVENGTSDVVAAWQRVPTSFESTGSETVYEAMVPVGTSGQAIKAALGAAASALDTYVAEVVPLLAKIATLKGEIERFQSVTIPSYPKDKPDVPTYNSYVSNYQSSSTGGYNSYSYSGGGTATQTAAKPQYESWRDDPIAVEDNHDHLVQAQQYTAELLALQETCANAIRKAVGLPEAYTDEVQAQIHQLTATDFHWNAQVAIQNDEEGCAGSTNRAVNGIFYDGLFINGVVGTIQGLGGLIGWDGDHDWSWETAGNSWLGLAHLASGLVLTSTGASFAIEAGPGTPGWLRDWNRDSTGAVLGLTNIVGVSLPTEWWDANAWTTNSYFTAWEQDGWATLGASAFNIGTFFTGAGGVAKAGSLVRGGVTAAEVAGNGGRLAEIVTDSGQLARLRAMTPEELRTVFAGMSHADAERLAAELANPAVDTAALSGLRFDDFTLHEHPTAADATANRPHDAAPDVLPGDRPTAATHPSTAPEAEPSPHASSHTGDATHEADAPSVAHTDDGVPATHSVDAAPVAHADDAAPVAHADATPAAHADDAAPAGHADDAGPAAHGDDAAQAAHADDAAPVAHADATPAAHADDAAQAAHTDDAAPVGHADDAAPTAHADDAAQAGRADDATPAAQADDAAPVAHADDATPAAHADNATPVAQAGDATPAGRADDATPTGQGGDATPVAHADDATGTHTAEQPAGDHVVRDADTPVDDQGRPTVHHLDDGTSVPVRYEESGAKGAWNKNLYWRNLDADTRYVVDDGKFVYDTDSMGRVVHAEGHLDSADVAPDKRHDGQQRTVGGESRIRRFLDTISWDHGSHLYANRFLGPGEGINQVALHGRMNLVDMKNLETGWAQHIQDPGVDAAQRHVTVVYDIEYGAARRRPDVLNGEFRLGDGMPVPFKVTNPVPPGWVWKR